MIVVRMNDINSMICPGEEAWLLAVGCSLTLFCPPRFFYLFFVNHFVLFIVLIAVVDG